MWFYNMDSDLVYCNNIKWCFYNSEHRLQSTTCLKAILLHDGNPYPSVAVDHVASMKASYENLNNHICDEFKVIAVLMWMQQHSAKYFYLLSLE